MKKPILSLRDQDGKFVPLPAIVGPSAYKTWLMLGHVGSEQDFLDSLKGGKGDKGDTPILGTDYFTPEQVTDLAKETSKIVGQYSFEQTLGTSPTSGISQKAQTDLFAWKNSGTSYVFNIKEVGALWMVSFNYPKKQFVGVSKAWIALFSEDGNIVKKVSIPPQNMHSNRQSYRLLVYGSKIYLLLQSAINGLYADRELQIYDSQLNILESIPIGEQHQYGEFGNLYQYNKKIYLSYDRVFTSPTTVQDKLLIYQIDQFENTLTPVESITINNRIFDLSQATSLTCSNVKVNSKTTGDIGIINCKEDGLYKNILAVGDLTYEFVVDPQLYGQILILVPLFYNAMIFIGTKKAGIVSTNTGAPVISAIGMSTGATANQLNWSLRRLYNAATRLRSTLYYMYNGDSSAYIEGNPAVGLLPMKSRMYISIANNDSWCYTLTPVGELQEIIYEKNPY